MHVRPLLVLLSVLAAGLARAESQREHARRAQVLLDGNTWSRVIEVQNQSRGGAYPRTVYALVFEWAGMLWFYTAVDGTQSFSLHRGRLAEEKADFGPLLRDIDAGFSRWRVVPDEAEGRVVSPGPLPNGCFIESLAALRERRLRGERMGKPRLLSYYAKTRAGQLGHTVLVFEHDDVVEVFDPGRPEASLAFPAGCGREPLRLARMLEPDSILKARFLVVPSGEEPLPLIAAGSAAGGGSEMGRDRS